MQQTHFWVCVAFPFPYWKVLSVRFIQTSSFSTFYQSRRVGESPSRLVAIWNLSCHSDSPLFSISLLYIFLFFFNAYRLVFLSYLLYAFGAFEKFFHTYFFILFYRKLWQGRKRRVSLGLCVLIFLYF